MNISNYKPWPDKLRALAIFGVIVVHTSAPLLAKGYNFSGVDYNWWVANIYNSAARYCVPVFVMLSGALLLNREYTYPDFLKRKLLRIVLPFLFWVIIYLIYNYVHSNHKQGLLTWLNTEIGEGISYHFWYVYMIIGLYAIIPVLSKWTAHSNEQDILYFLVICMVVLLLKIPVLQAFTMKIDWGHFSGYAGYLVLGYYLSVKKFKTGRLQWIGFSLYLCGVLITIAGTYYMLGGKGHFSPSFYNNFMPNVLFASAGIFLCLKTDQPDRSSLLADSIRKPVSRYSYGIYLVHVLVLTELNRAGINGSMIHPLLAIPLTALICLFISYLIVFGLNKLPFGKYLAG